MIGLFLILFSIFGFPRGAELVYALQNEEQIVMINRIELPTYYLFFILFGIVAISWGILRIFQHKDHHEH